MNRPRRRYLESEAQDKADRLGCQSNDNPEKSYASRRPNTINRDNRWVEAMGKKQAIAEKHISTVKGKMINTKQNRYTLTNIEYIYE